MRWKRVSNFIIAIIFSIAFVITTLLNVIGPMHMNQTGAMNQLGSLALYSLAYFVGSLIILWGLYFSLKNRPELLFFSLIVGGIIIIILENFLWAVSG